MTLNQEIARNYTYTYDGSEAAFGFQDEGDRMRYRYFGARNYDPKISIWLSVDPLADKYPSHSPYNYTLNNPIRLIDPIGMGPTDSEVNTIKDQSNATKVYPTDLELKKTFGPDA